MPNRSEGNISLFERIKLTPEKGPQQKVQNEGPRKSLRKILQLRLFK